MLQHGIYSPALERLLSNDSDGSGNGPAVPVTSNTGRGGGTACAVPIATKLKHASCPQDFNRRKREKLSNPDSTLDQHPMPRRQSSTPANWHGKHL